MSNDKLKARAEEVGRRYIDGWMINSEAYALINDLLTALEEEQEPVAICGGDLGITIIKGKSVPIGAKLYLKEADNG